MTIANVSLTNTFDEWRTVTNQLIGVYEETNTLAVAAYDSTNSVTFTAANLAANVLASNTIIMSAISDTVNNAVPIVMTSNTQIITLVTNTANTIANNINYTSLIVANSIIRDSMNVTTSNTVNTMMVSNTTILSLISNSANTTANNINYASIVVSNSTIRNSINVTTSNTVNTMMVSNTTILSLISNSANTTANNINYTSLIVANATIRNSINVTTSNTVNTMMVSNTVILSLISNSANTTANNINYTSLIVANATIRNSINTAANLTAANAMVSNTTILSLISNSANTTANNINYASVILANSRIMNEINLASSAAASNAVISNTTVIATVYDNANTIVQGFVANTDVGASFATANAAYSVANAAFDKANSANLLASNTGTGANAYATLVGTSANAFMISVQNGSNTAVGTGANAYAAIVGAAANSIAIAAFGRANSSSNTFSSNVVISVADNTNAALRITQTGSGNALLVQDEANPDSSPFAINNDGRVIIGKTATQTLAGATPQVQLHSNIASSLWSSYSVFNWHASNQGAGLVLAKSKSGTIGTQGAIVSADTIADIHFYGDDGTGFIQAALISAQVDGTTGTNDMPGRLTFSTTADGASSSTERMRIDSSGNIGIGTSTPAVKLDIVGSATVSSQVNVGAIIGAGGVSDLLLGSINGNSPFVASEGAYPLLFQTNSLERMRVAANGNVAIGSTSTDLAKLYVDGTIIGTQGFTSRVPSGLANTARGFRQLIDGTEYLSFYHDNANAIIEVNGTERIRIVGAGGNVGISGNVAVTGTVSATDFNSLSDYNLKTNIIGIGGALDTINSLNGVSFEWKNNGKRSYGVIAQELEKHIPDLVGNIDGTKNVNYDGIIAFLIEAIKELNRKLDAK